MGSFHRVDTSKLVRGAARFMHAPASQAKPTKILDIIALAGTDTNEIQQMTVTGTPAGGNFTVMFNGTATPIIPWNSTAAAVKLILEDHPDIDVGDVLTAGGPFPATPITVTFTGKYAARDIPAMSLGVNALTGGTTPNVTFATNTPGAGLYGAMPGWLEFGGTREGIQISVNNTEDSFEIDQVPGEVGSAPNAWECFVTTRLAEMTLETFVIVWEGAVITEDLTTTPHERETGFAGATSYTERRLAVLFQRPNGKLQAFMFHRAVRSPQEGSLDFRKGGDPQTLQVRFKVLADSTELDPKKQFFRVREQV